MTLEDLILGRVTVEPNDPKLEHFYRRIRAMQRHARRQARRDCARIRRLIETTTSETARVPT